MDEHLSYELAARLRLILVPLTRELRQQGTVRFTPTQLSVIGAVRSRGPISVGEIAAEERLSPATVSKAIVSLESEGIFERLYDDNDRRICRIKMTKLGEQWLEKTRSERDAWLSGRIAKLSPAEQAVLSAAIPVLECFMNNVD